MRGPLVVWLLVVLPPAVAQQTAMLPEPREYPDCDLPEPRLFIELAESIENLAFDGKGSLFLTTYQGLLYRAFPDGTAHVVWAETERATVTPGVQPESLTGLAVGPQGALFVAQGHSVPSAAVNGRVLRFPEPGGPAFDVYAEGFPSTNGMAADAAGNLYLAHGFRDEIWRIAPGGAWTLWTRLPGANGLVLHPDGAHLVVGTVSDPAQPVTSLALADPQDRQVLFRWNIGPSPDDPGSGDTAKPVHDKGLDDLVVALDGRLYVSAHLRWQVLRGDPATGEGCVAIDYTELRDVPPGFTGGEPTSVRIAEGFGDWDGFLFSTDAAGQVWVLDIRPAPPTGAAADDDAPAAQDGDGRTVGGTPWLLAMAAVALGAILATARRGR